jgi:hypothetical protein
MYFTLPPELTGRNPEPVRCSARVVYVEQHGGRRGLLGIAATVERFEAMTMARSSDNSRGVRPCRRYCGPCGWTVNVTLAAVLLPKRSATRTASV